MNDNYLQVETICNAMEKRHRDIRTAAMNACKGRNDVPLEIIQKGLGDLEQKVRAAAMNACEGSNIPIKTIQDWLEDSDWHVRAAAMNACKGRGDVPLEVIQEGLEDSDPDVRNAAVGACWGRDMSRKIIREWLNAPDWCNRVAALNACIGRNIPLKIRFIQELSRDPNWHIRMAAMNACRGRDDIPLETIRRRLSDAFFVVSVAAMNACEGRGMSFEIIQEWLNDPDWRVRKAAICACKKRDDVPHEILQKGMEDLDLCVRIAAMDAYEGRDVPYSRTFNPDGYVYKRCLNSVIVVAEIPQDAHVRGEIGRKCRASKAIIKEIEGSFLGEEVGISIFDKSTAYRIGDIVTIADFDLGNRECSTGFHFYNSLEEAKSY